jgi:hypothetical protein
MTVSNPSEKRKYHHQTESQLSTNRWINFEMDFTITKPQDWVQE